MDEERDVFHSQMFKDIVEEHRKEALERLFTEALEKWLDRKFSEFGRWTLKGVAAVAFSGLIYIYIHTGGFKP